MSGRNAFLFRLVLGTAYVRGIVNGVLDEGITNTIRLFSYFRDNISGWFTEISGSPVQKTESRKK